MSIALIAVPEPTEFHVNVGAVLGAGQSMEVANVFRRHRNMKPSHDALFKPPSLDESMSQAPQLHGGYAASAAVPGVAESGRQPVVPPRVVPPRERLHCSHCRYVRYVLPRSTMCVRCSRSGK